MNERIRDAETASGTTPAKPAVRRKLGIAAPQKAAQTDPIISPAQSSAR
jgi:hypothetical protein